MSSDHFDEMVATALANAEGRTRRTLLGGSLGTLLATARPVADDAAAAKSPCEKKCKKKKSKKKRKKCLKGCQVGEPLSQQGSATLTSRSDQTCASQGQCIYDVSGALTGTPIAAGTFTGTLTGSNYRNGSAPNTFAADYTGALTATETATGETLSAPVALVLTEDNSTGAITFSGTYQISGGTGRFAGATGSGTVSGSGTNEFPIASVTSFTMEGTIAYV